MTIEARTPESLRVEILEIMDWKKRIPEDGSAGAGRALILCCEGLGKLMVTVCELMETQAQTIERLQRLETPTLDTKA